MAKCEPGCTCSRHKVYYRGGSKKGRTLSDEAKQNIAKGAQNRKVDKEALAAQLKSQREDPDFEAKRVAALKKSLTGKKCPEGCECGKHSESKRAKVSQARAGVPLTEEWKTNIGAASKTWWANKTPEDNAARGKLIWGTRREVYGPLGASKPPSHRRVSRMETLLIPYMEALGYEHNTEIFIANKVPDFVDIKGRRVFEFFGNFWHQDEDEVAFLEHYESRGWACEILWEQDLVEWLERHQELVTEEQHLVAIASVVVDPRYRR